MPKLDLDDPKLKILLLLKLERVCLNAIESTMMRLWQKILTEYIPGYPRIPVDRATYKAGFAVTSGRNGSVLYNTAPHASLVESGVRPENVKPGKKMRQAIEEWLVRKQICDREEAPGVAFAVVNRMKKTGIFMTAEQGARPGGGLQIMKRALGDLEGVLVEEIQEEIRKAFPS